MSEVKLDPEEIFSAGLLLRTGTDPTREICGSPPRLTRVRMGEYVETHRWAELSAGERHRALVLATVRRMRGADQIVSHLSAAAVWQMPIIGAWPARVHVTMDALAAGSSALISRHRISRMPEGVERHGIVVTSPARTVVDIARTSCLASALTAADWTVRNRLCTLAEIDCEVDAIEPGRRGRVGAQALQLLVDPRSQSPGESLSRARMYELGFAQPSLQVPLEDGRGEFGAADFGWPGVIGEFDGERKYRATGDAGDTASEDVVIKEKKREDRIRRTRVQVARWCWSDALPPGAEGMVAALQAVGLSPQGSPWSPYPRD